MSVITWLIKLTGSEKYAHLMLAAIAAAFVAMLCGASYWRGYQAADQKALIATLKNDKGTLQTQLTTAKRQITQLETVQHDNQRLTTELAHAQGKERIAYRTIRQQATALNTATVNNRAADQHATDGTRAVCAVSAEYVRLWNAALFPGSDGRVPEATSNTDDGPAAATGVDAGQLLANHIDNSEINSANVRQCNALIDWHRQHDK